MPYYCTVPRCTSMAGKAKNVSFHQFPRDEELARLWNKILKRGKPYTKYSKVCSLHFRPEDYTITSVGKNKGQWRTLRKDAIPSQNLPIESPGPTAPRHRSSDSWPPSTPPNAIDSSRMQQQMAQAIYMQTMLAMQAANSTSLTSDPNTIDSTTPHTSNPSLSDIEQLLQRHTPNGLARLQDAQNGHELLKQENHNFSSYKCEECSKCFKDPDVFVLHRRTHNKKQGNSIEKENFNANSGISKQETLKANPILANLLKSSIPGEADQMSNGFNNVFDVNNILSIENQIMTALAANMESYIRNLSSMLAQAPKDTSVSNGEQNSDMDTTEEKFVITEEEKEVEESDCDMKQEEINEEEERNGLEDGRNEDREEANLISEEAIIKSEETNLKCEQSNESEDVNIAYKKLEKTNTNCEVAIIEHVETHLNYEEQEKTHIKLEEINTEQEEKGSIEEMEEPSCDNQDLIKSKDSINLVIR